MMHCPQQNDPIVNHPFRAHRRSIVRTPATVLSALVVLALCFVLSAAAQTTVATDSTVQTIRLNYEKGAYLAAEVDARRYLEQQTPPDSLRIAAEQYLAFALVAQGKTKPALIHFTAILEIDSTFELDPVYTSPKILASFNEAKQARLSRKRGDPEQAQQSHVGSSSAVSWRVLVFPGWEQLHQARDSKGYALLSAGALAIGLSVVLEIERSNARTDYFAASTPDQAVARYDRYNRAHKAETYSILAFAAIYLYGEIDAFLNLPHSDAVAVRPDAGGLHIAVRF